MIPPAAGHRAFPGALTSLAVCLLLAALLVGCSPQSADPGSRRGPDRTTRADARGSVTLAAAPVTTRTGFHRVHGRLPEARRKPVRREVAKVVQRWWQAAYLGGTYPRTGFRDAFPGFTRGARAQARRDVRLMSNRDIGGRVDSVTQEVGKVRLDVLAVDGRAHAVTARFRLRFSTTGRAARTTVVRGRLFLTQRHGPWRVFGYDVSKGARP